MNLAHYRSIVNFHLLLLVFLFGVLQDYPNSLETLSVRQGPMDWSIEAEKFAKSDIELLIDEAITKDATYFVGISEIVVSKEDIDFLAHGPQGCQGHLLGALIKDRLVIKDSDNATNKKTLYHELGHNVWRRLSEEQKAKWPFLEPFVSEYAKVSPEEDFAESFSCAKTNLQKCKELLSKEKITFINQI